MGRLCVTLAQCQGLTPPNLAMYTDDTLPPAKTCVAVCDPLLWTDKVARKCDTACFGGTYSFVSARQCISNCAVEPTSLTLATNSSCLLPAECTTAGLLVTPSTKTCSSSCAAGLYLDVVTSQCLNAAECRATSSGTGLLTEFDKKCVPACNPATQYRLVYSSQCLLESECMAIPTGSGGGLLKPLDRTCVSACSITEY